MKKLVLPAALLLIFCVSIPASSSSTIAKAKFVPEGTTVNLTSGIVTACYDGSTSFFYVEDADFSVGIRVITGGSIPTGVSEGKVVTVNGVTCTLPNGERAINDASITVTGSASVPEGRVTDNRTIGGTRFGFQEGVHNGLGPNNVGLFIKTFGWLSSIDQANSFFTLDDGSGGRARISSSLLVNKPCPGDFVRVCGIVSTIRSEDNILPVIMPRRQTDVMPSNPKFEAQINSPVPEGKLAVHWLGQGGWLLRDSAGNRIAVDPYLSDFKGSGDPDYARLMPVPIPPEKLNPGLVLLTHRHSDHTDPWTLKPVYANSQSVFWGPTTVTDRLKSSEIGITSTRVKTLNRGQTAHWNGIQISAVYANHPSDTTYDAVGYVINMAGKKMYISGDTLYDQTLVSTVKSFSPDVILVCINGQGGNMNASEAASLVKACGPQTTAPMHYGMFIVNTVDPQAFVDACGSQGVTANVVVMGTFGRMLL